MKNPFFSNNMTERAKFMVANANDPAKVKRAWEEAGLDSPMGIQRTVDIRPTPKVQNSTCPCGIHRSDCDYHNV